MIAFVFSGGSSLAAVQVGMLQALNETGVKPDILVGTSAGAVNGAWVAGHDDGRGFRDLEPVWSRLRRQDIFPFSPANSLAGLIGRRNHLVSNNGIRELLEREVSFSRLEDAPIPLHVVAVNLLTGREVLLSRGDAVEALLATTALPGVYPPVFRDGVYLIDGGVADNTPISHAVDLGATRIYVLPSGYACALKAPPISAVSLALHALTLSIQQRLIADVERYEPHIQLVVVPPLCPLDVSPADFSRSMELIGRARRATRRWLRNPPSRTGQAHQLRFHEHRAVAQLRAQRSDPRVPMATTLTSGHSWIRA